MNTDEGGEGSRHGSDSEEARKSDVDVPDADEDDPSGAFRRRVVRGLGDTKGGALAPAVRRYQEGLLR